MSIADSNNELKQDPSLVRAAISESGGLFIMGKRIEHQQGELVGECIFLHELPSVRKPSGPLVRMATFKCIRCGSEFNCPTWAVRNKKTKSCGCLNGKLPNHRPKQHGLRRSDVYWRWVNIKRRCFNKSYNAYTNYGARGITMCDEWRYDFKAFYDYVTQLQHYREPGMTLDRIDNNGNYEPGNVRWTTMYVQTVNQRMQKNNTTGYIGVSRCGDKFAASISVNGVRRRFGSNYLTAYSAALVRDKFIIENNLINHPLNILIFA